MELSEIVEQILKITNESPHSHLDMDSTESGEIWKILNKELIQTGKFTVGDTAPTSKFTVGDTAPTSKFAVGAEVEIHECIHGHEFEFGEKVILIERDEDMWCSINEKGVRWFIGEDEANVC